MSLSFLTGLRVLDLSQYIPGPYAAQMLADLGAEVVKLEPPTGDPMRRFDPPDDDGLCAAYKLINAGKRVILLDLKTPIGQKQALSLLARADVLIESFRPGTLDRLGLSRDRLIELNPRLIHVALSGWGQEGPYRSRAGHDVTYMALGGGLISSGIPETPVLICPPMADHAGAQQTVSAVLAALYGRTRTGQGAYLDVSLMESVLSWQSVPLTLAARGQSTTRGGNLLTGGAAWYRLYRTADGRFAALAAIEDKFWQAFCVAVGHQEWIARHKDPMPQTELIRELDLLFSGRTLKAWQELLDPVDCCFEALLNPEEVSNHPHIAVRKQITQRGEGAQILVETLLGLRVNGDCPPTRRPLIEDDAACVLADWTSAAS
ncbi:alpha-methylacyl-CoA racemase [Azospirillaceae bacterium]